MIGIPIGLFFANAFEWYAHKRILHDLGRDKKGIMHSHWDHHRDTRRTAFRDPIYTDTWYNDRALQEAMGVGALAVFFAPLFPVAPFFTGTVFYSAYNYWRVHRKSHRDPEWTKKHLPWHYDHHMGMDQDLNWCVTRPWFDYIMGTRVAGKETEIEKNVLGIDLPDWAGRAINELAARRGWKALSEAEWRERKKLKKSRAAARKPEEAELVAPG